MNLSILYISNKWNHAMRGLLWLAFFKNHDVIKAHLCCNMSTAFFFNCWVLFHCINMPHFVCSSADRHLGSFHLLALMDNATVNIHIPVSAWHMFSFVLGIYLAVELLTHTLTLCLVFWGTAKLFCKVAVPLNNSTTGDWKTPVSPHPCPNLLFFILFVSAFVGWYFVCLF